MTRFIASIIFVDKENNSIPYLLRYNSGDIPPDDSFEQVKHYIEEKDGVSYQLGKPIPCYSDARYIAAYANIDEDYSFLFFKTKEPRDENKFKKPIQRRK
jgi:hypothetical protein